MLQSMVIHMYFNALSLPRAKNMNRYKFYIRYNFLIIAVLGQNKLFLMHVPYFQIKHMY